MDNEQKNRAARRRQTASQPPVKQAEGQHRKSAAPVAGKNAGQKRPAPQKAATKAASRPEQKTRPQGAAVQSRPQRAVQQAAASKQPRRTAAPQRTQEEHPNAKRSVQLGGAHMHAARQRTAQEQKEAREKSKLLGVGTKGTPSNEERTLKKNSLHSFISGARGQQDQSWEEKSRERQKKRALEAERKRKQAQRDNTPAVIYTQPAAFNRNRLLIQLMTVTAIVLALILGMSVFFKVDKITVAGAQVYDPYTIQQASGISKGDNLLTFSRARAGAKIRAELGYVDTVRIGIKLPDTVIIYIEEFAVSYAIKSSDGDWWLINSDGRVVEQVDGATASNYTQVLGVTIADPKINEAAVATEMPPTETDPSGEPVPVLVTGAQRLHSALQILKALEANDIVGEAASVDVSILESIVLWYGTRYQVNLGDTSRMEYKIAYMKGTILELSDYQSGILDISFTIWPNQAGYTPFG